MHKASQLQFRNKSALFTDKYLFRYLPRKHERQTQHLYFQYCLLGNIAGEQGEEGSFVIIFEFLCKNQLPPLQIKEEILIYSGGRGISVG